MVFPHSLSKKTSTVLLIPLCLIFNYSLSTSTIPSLWRKSIVVPLFKKGKREDPKNYRPVSLTSVICRLMEKIIHFRILDHFFKNNLISSAQHGFISKRSTQTQQVIYLDKLTSLYDQGLQVEAIYLDFSKAFDRVSHLKLLYILDFYGLNSHLINWIQGYLSCRTQVTVVDTIYSDVRKVTSGVPQGSVLGPLLFVIFVNDLIDRITTNCRHTDVFAFADDIKLMGTNFNDLQLALDIVHSWTLKWGLTLNTAKSEHITFRNKTQVTFTIGNQDVPHVDQVRDLGIILRSDLKWSSYIEKIRSKTNSLFWLIVRTFSSGNPKLMTNLYKTYIRPLIEYNTCSWSPHLQTEVDEVESIQRRITKSICQRANINFSSYEKRLEKLQLESLKSRRVKSDLTFLYKIINGLVDVEAANILHFSHLGGYNLRRHTFHIYRQKLHKTQIRQGFFSSRVINYWNQLTEDIVSSATLSSFKLKIKKLTFKT